MEVLGLAVSVERVVEMVYALLDVLFPKPEKFSLLWYLRLLGALLLSLGLGILGGWVLGLGEELWSSLLLGALSGFLSPYAHQILQFLKGK